MSQFAFKNAVVVGASGGIGHAMARTIAERGKIACYLLSRSTIGDVVPGSRTGHIDIVDEESIAAAAAGVAKTGEVDLIIVTTGLLHHENLQPEKSWRQLSSGALTEYFLVNAIGPALVAKHFLPLMPRNRRAVFACLSARVGSITDNRLGGWYGYRASKAALNMLVKTLAIELARSSPQSICVAIHPGTVSTNLSDAFKASALSAVTPDEAAHNILDLIENLKPEDSGGFFAWDGSAIAP